MAVRQSNPDLMFLDVQMPGMDGFEVLSALRDERLPMIVFITAYDQYALRAFEACAVDYILKPFDRTRFERAVQQVKNRIRQERRTDLTQHLLTLLQNLNQPPGYPGDHPLVPHGVSVILNAPAVFRATAAASPARHLQAAEALGVDISRARPDAAGRILADRITWFIERLALPWYHGSKTRW